MNGRHHQNHGSRCILVPVSRQHNETAKHNNPYFKPRGWISGIGWMLVAHQTTKTHTHTGWELGRLEHEEHKIYNTKQKQAIIDKREHPTKP